MKNFYPEGLLEQTPENKAGLINAASLRLCAESGKILEAKAFMCDADHNLIVNLGSVRGIIPRNEGAIGISDGSVALWLCD